MFKVLALSLLGLKLVAQPVFLKVIQDSLTLPNYGKVAFIDQDATFIHVLFNSNYVASGFCDGGNGSIYYVKLNKSNGLIVNTRSFRNSVSKVTAACMYKNNIYFGGEMAPTSQNRNAFIIKFNTQTNSIIWQKFFHTTWWSPAVNTTTSCYPTQIELNLTKDKLFFYGVGNNFASNIGAIMGLGSFKGIIDTSNTVFNAVNYGWSQTGVLKTKPKFTNAKLGTKSYIISSDSGSNMVNIMLNMNYNSYFSGDYGYSLNLISTGHHYVTNLGSKIVYLIDRQSQSTCFITDSLNNILISNDFVGLHARSIVVKSNYAVLTFINDLGSGNANEIINIKIDTLMSVLNSKKMVVDTFLHSDFSCSSILDSSFIYNLYSKREYSANTIFVYKSNFQNFLCNEYVYTPTLSPISINTILATSSATGGSPSTTLTINSYADGLKDSVFCSGNNSISQLSFILNSMSCIGHTETISANTGTSIALTYTWTSVPTGAIFSSPNSSSTNVYFPVSGTYTIGISLPASGGTISAQNVITIFPAPTISLSQSNLTTCIGSNYPLYSKPVHLVAAGGISYTWNPPPGPSMVGGNPNGPQNDVGPIMTSCFTVTGKDQNGCRNWTSTCINVIPQFSITTSPSTTTTCFSSESDSASTVILTMGNPSSPAHGLPSSYGYTWTSSTGGIGILTTPFAANIAVYHASTITFTAEIKDSLGCISLPATATVISLNCSGISENERELSLQVFPNPANKFLELKIKDLDLENYFDHINIYNNLGQLIREEEFTINIGTENLTEGVYFLELNGSQGTVRKRFVVTR